MNARTGKERERERKRREREKVTREGKKVRSPKQWMMLAGSCGTLEDGSPSNSSGVSSSSASLPPSASLSSSHDPVAIADVDVHVPATSDREQLVRCVHPARLQASRIAAVHQESRIADPLAVTGGARSIAMIVTISDLG